MERVSKSIAGRKIPCPRCGATATVTLDEYRYHTRCVSCGDNSLLKEYKSLTKSYDKTTTT